jgi:hypothetical protein
MCCNSCPCTTFLFFFSWKKTCPLSSSLTWLLSHYTTCHLMDRHNSLLWFEAGEIQCITPRRKGGPQGANEASRGTAPIPARVVRFGDGYNATLRDSAGGERASIPSLEKLRASMTRSHSESEIAVIMSRAASSQFSGEQSYATICCHWGAGGVGVSGSF